MNVGTKSVLFGVHQFILHPIFVIRAWRILYRDWPTLVQWCAIFTHDLGYFGKPNMDGPEGQMHPEVMAEWWRKRFGQSFGDQVAREILGHSRFHATRAGLPLSKLYRPDKLATALYPRWLYLLLGRASGEVREYMVHYAEGHYTGKARNHSTMTEWLLEVQAQCALLGIEGDDNEILKRQKRRGTKGTRDVAGIEVVSEACPWCGRKQGHAAGCVIAEGK